MSNIVPVQSGVDRFGLIPNQEELERLSREDEHLRIGNDLVDLFFNKLEFTWVHGKDRHEGGALLEIPMTNGTPVLRWGINIVVGKDGIWSSVQVVNNKKDFRGFKIEKDPNLGNLIINYFDNPDSGLENPTDHELFESVDELRRGIAASLGYESQGGGTGSCGAPLSFEKKTSVTAKAIRGLGSLALAPMKAVKRYYGNAELCDSHGYTVKIPLGLRRRNTAKMIIKYSTFAAIAAFPLPNSITGGKDRQFVPDVLEAAWETYNNFDR